MDHAILRNNNAFLKPNPYVEILVNGKSVRKTDTLKNTNHPRWEQELTILATPTSVLQFRVLDHSSFRKDTLLGEKTIHVGEILQMRDSRVDNYKLCMTLTKSPSETSPDGLLGRSTNSASEMFVVIKGLASMDQMDAVNGTGSSSPNVLGSTLNGSSAVRMRSRAATDEPEDVIMIAAASSSAAVGSAYGSNGGAIQRNSGLDWTGEVNSAGGGGADPKLLSQRNMAVQVSER